ncbi:MAG TPA: hypothetical protein VMV07_13725 [Streptosporangiaceae bacterium]|nr:hypothetical protein [Streptosporangiaceae bacterium]
MTRVWEALPLDEPLEELVLVDDEQAPSPTARMPADATVKSLL